MEKDKHENGDHTEDLAAESEEFLGQIKKRGRALLQDGLEEAKHLYSDKAAQVRQKAREVGDKSVEEITDDVKHYVRRNPLKSIAIAVGLGAVIGYVFKSDD